MRVVMLSKALVVASYRNKLQHLSSLGADMVAVVPPAWREEGRDITLEPGQDEAFETIIAPVAWNGHFHLHYYPSLPDILNRISPDILHVDEEPYNLSTFLAFRAAWKIRAKPLFFTWQNIDKLYPPPFGLTERYVFRRAAYGLAGSKDAEAILKEKGFRGPVRVIPQFGVDTEAFTPKERLQQPFTIGYLGRLVPEKGVADLLAAFERLNPSTRLVIAGNGPLTRFVEQETIDLERQDRLERLDRVPSTDMPGLLGRIDVVVLPSRTTTKWREQYGRILIEAMASGTVVVGSDSGEIPNVIADAGIVFPEGNVEKLAEALIHLSESPELRAKLRRLGRKRAVDCFSQASVAERTYAVYEAIL